MPSFSNIEEEIQTILDSFADIELGEAHADNVELSEEQKAALNAYLDELGMQEKDKIDAFGQYLRFDAAKAEALRAEAQRLTQKARAIENRDAHMKEYYIAVAKAHGLKKIEGNTYTMSVRNTKVCSIPDESLVPDEWCKIETKRTPVKRDILFALKQGTVIPGCSIGITESLLIK